MPAGAGRRRGPPRCGCSSSTPSASRAWRSCGETTSPAGGSSTTPRRDRTGRHQVHRRMKIGVIGAGVMARRHLQVLTGLEGASVTAVCDADPGRAEALAAEAGARAFGDWRPMVEGAALDAVFVCTPPAAHAAPAIAAMEAGLAVYLEKPLA